MINNLQGWLNIYKPINISSFKVLQKIKKKYNIKKIGHAGTLDPLAEGILPVAIEKTTKLIPFINNEIKEYEFEIKWGEQTSTDDSEGYIIERSYNIPEHHEINLKLKNFKGKLKDIFDNFCKESHEELFETQKEAIDFYSKDENYDKLFNGDIGDNLLGKYSALALLNITDIISTIFYVIRNKFNIKVSQKFNHVLDSSEKWLKNLYIIENISVFERCRKSRKRNAYFLPLRFSLKRKSVIVL